MKQLETTLCIVGKLLVSCLCDCCFTSYSFICYCRVDIEAQMTMFAYYYVGIGIGVLFVSYFQVRIHAIFSLNFIMTLLHIPHRNNFVQLLLVTVDRPLDVSSCETNLSNEKDLLQKNNANGDWMV